MTTRSATVLHKTLYILALALLCGRSYAENFTRVISLSSSTGWKSMADLTLSGSTLYGTASAGGSSDGGCIFKINTNGTGYTVLKDFAATGERSPWSPLTISGSTLYGTTQQGGISDYGTVFKLNTDGTGYSVLHRFGSTNGAHPVGGLVLSGSTLYGTTASGGTNWGTVFKIDTNGTGFAVLKYFVYATGAAPYARLTLAGSTLYGTTFTGGNTGTGTIFKLNTNGTGYSVVWNFTNSSGGGPHCSLVLAGTALYGTTWGGGPAGYGSIFKVNTDGTGFVTLRNFSSNDGANPYAGLELAGDTLYGTTYNGGNNNGTIFQINTNGTGFLTLRQLAIGDGTHPDGGLVHSGGVLYGATYLGGGYGGGSVYSIDLSRTPPAITSQPQSRTNAVGSTALLQVTAEPKITGLSYQWRQYGTNLTNGGMISGATSNVLAMSNVQAGNVGNYTVVVTNNNGSVTSSVAVLVVVRPPIAGSDAFEVPLGLSLTIPEAQLLANDSDPDGTAINVSGVAATSDAGVGISRMPGGITYWGAFSGTSDHFAYMLTNASGVSATGIVNLTLTGSLPATNQICMQPLQNGSLRAVYLGRLTFRYALERTHDLTPPQIWEPQATNWAGAGGYTFFTNTPSPGTNNFYRIRWAQ